MYDFELDTGKLTQLIVKMYKTHDSLWANCDNLFGTTESMGEGWSGDAYEKYYSSIKQYENNVRAIPAILWAYRQAVIDARDDGNDLVTAVETALSIE